MLTREQVGEGVVPLVVTSIGFISSITLQPNFFILQRHASFTACVLPRNFGNMLRLQFTRVVLLLMSALLGKLWLLFGSKLAIERD